MWKPYFKFVKLRPGRVITALFGELDFSSDAIPLETIKSLYESDFPYLEITEAGKQELYGIKPDMPLPEKMGKPVRVKKQKNSSKNQHSK